VQCVPNAFVCIEIQVIIRILRFTHYCFEHNCVSEENVILKEIYIQMK